MVFVEVIISIFAAIALVVASGIAYKQITDPYHDDELVWWGTLKLIELLFVAYIIFNGLSRVG